MDNKFDLKDEVLKKLASVPSGIAKTYLRKALNKGGNIVKAAAVARAKRFDRPGTPKKVYEEIVVRANARLGKASGGYAISIGVKGGAKHYVSNKNNRTAQRVGKRYEGPGNVYYWRFLEFGTSKMKAQPFMRPALANNVDSVTSAVVSELNSGIDKLAAG